MTPIIDKELPQTDRLTHGQITSADVPYHLADICHLPFAGLHLRPNEDMYDKRIPNVFVLEMDDESPFAKAAGVESKIHVATISFEHDKLQVFSDLRSTKALQRLQRVIDEILVTIETHAENRATENDAAFLSLKENCLPVSDPKQTADKGKSRLMPRPKVMKDLQ